MLQLKIDIGKVLTAKGVDKLETEYKYKDEAINSLIFELYGLTQAEIAIIEQG